MNKKELKNAIIDKNLTGKVEDALILIIDNINVPEGGNSGSKKLTIKTTKKGDVSSLEWNDVKAKSYRVFIVEENKKPYKVYETKGFDFDISKYVGNIDKMFVMAILEKGKKKSNTLTFERF